MQIRTRNLSWNASLKHCHGTRIASGCPHWCSDESCYSSRKESSRKESKKQKICTPDLGTKLTTDITVRIHRTARSAQGRAMNVMDLLAMAGSLPSTSAIARSTCSSSASSRSLSVFTPRNLKLSSKSAFCASIEELSASCTSKLGVGAPALPKCRVSVRASDSSSSSSLAQKKDATNFRQKSPKDTNVVIVGSTGYIGKFVVKEMVKRGYNVIAVAREKSGIGGKSGKEKTQEALVGAQVCFSDVTDAASLQEALKATQPSVDVVISCLASRGGGVRDSWLVDYTATKNSLDAGRALGASHFVLLSAICVQKPLLEFQRAKLKFEEELQSDGESLTYAIVRPTAFFKSLGGQVKSVQGGGPYVMFGDGALSSCKPISEADLARFIADSVSNEEMVNKVLPIGGPGKAVTPLEQGQMLFRILGKEPKFVKVPIQIMDFFIGQLDFWKKFFPKLEDAAELGKIGRYYASESMLVLNPETGKYDADATPSYGTDTLEDFFERVVRDGMAGQELGDQAVF